MTMWIWQARAKSLQLPVYEGAELSALNRTRPTPLKEKTRRGCRRATTSEHLHPGLRPEHSLLIGGQDQRLFAGHVVRLC